ncbi:hypothetical protein ABG768_027175 [Culter alburnus]|uniref:Uncharacterized protein n=1 Tax=Culter alburnus TaxID=194366 RepID=A0AAW2A7C6_CULAL
MAHVSYKAPSTRSKVSSTQYLFITVLQIHLRKFHDKLRSSSLLQLLRCGKDSMNRQKRQVLRHSDFYGTGFLGWRDGSCQHLSVDKSHVASAEQERCAIH